MTCATNTTMSTDPQPSTDAPAKRRKPLLIAIGIIVVLALTGGAALVWYLNQPVPEEVSIEGAVEDASTTLPGATTQSATETNGLDGSWSIDTSIGEFSFEDATSSFVGFRIDEELATVGATTAVGRTPAVGGSFALNGAVITETAIEADMTEIVTNASRRDQAVQRALDTATFPTATFTLTLPMDLGAIPAENEPVSATAVGDLTIKGVKQPIEILLEAQLVGDLIVVVGAVEVTFADWGIEVPTAPIVASVEDHGILELQLFFTRG
jgi:polyisoprenoid-binding protein YceI